MAEVSINGTSRTEFGKGASRRARRDGQVPAVIYGHGAEPVHITLPARELGNALKESNVLLNITFDGKTELTLPKSVVKNPLKQNLEHIDLVLVRRGEKVTVQVPVHTEGKHDPDGILEHVHNTIEVEAEATAIPQFLVLNIEGMKAGTSKTAADVTLPAGVTLVLDATATVVHLSERRAAGSSDEAAAPAAEAAAPAAE
ncbi:MAG: 50S ribosomal protein L25/general stress protein Ctc [Candidatus Planktophila sp.]